MTHAPAKQKWICVHLKKHIDKTVSSVLIILLKKRNCLNSTLDNIKHIKYVFQYEMIQDTKQNCRMKNQKKKFTHNEHNQIQNVHNQMQDVEVTTAGKL